MLTPDRLVMVCVAYVAVLFLLAYVVDRRAQDGKARWISSPVIYTLSISVYCTSWTFYGAVGSAARNGLEFITIYLGPTLVFVGWWWLLRKLVRIGRVHRITSIADLISSRYGKSPALAVLVTLIAVTATTPYIALQLQGVTLSFEALVGGGAENSGATAFWVAAGMALFTILFGTRSVDANERHHGVVAAIALEALVKLAALVAVGIFVVYGVMGDFATVFARAPERLLDVEQVFGPRWVALTFLSATAIICLPRQFQVTVVENADERHLATASWMFPLYLFLMCIFVVPIAIAGLTEPGFGGNPDMYMLSVPLAKGREDLALLAFIGGFSSATSMVIVAAIALSTMISNHIVVPLALRFLESAGPHSGDVRDLLLISRRVSIAAILGLGFLYFKLTGGTGALASIGLIAFAGIAQVLPSLVGGIFWRGATRAGALSGLICGALLWAYTLFLPSFDGEFILSKEILAEGLFGISLLRPQALMGLEGSDPLIHALVWSLGVNTLAFLMVSLLTFPRPLERLQGALFVDVFRSPTDAQPIVQRSATAEDLFVLAQRILGVDYAERLFTEIAREQGVAQGLPRPTDACIARLERELAGSVGAASAHAMVSSVAGSETIGFSALIDIADETQQLIETSARLADKTAELERTAAQLREVNTQLRALDHQKDEFLSQVSHELRTPMTSIRSFSEILLGDELDQEQANRFATIIHEESLRLTRLLDEILDINRLESGSEYIATEVVEAETAVRGAAESLYPIAKAAGVTIHLPEPLPNHHLRANPDRLRQVLVNLIGNAIKYNTSAIPEVTLSWHVDARRIAIDVADNGGGVTREEAQHIFAKFARGKRTASAHGAGLGLAISRAIMRRMNGSLTVEFNEDGSSFFRVGLPRAFPPKVENEAAAE